jgi:hypothetical protein
MASESKLGATDILPAALADFLRRRYGLQVPQATPSRPGSPRD